MVGLVDIGKLNRSITIRGQVLSLTGLKGRVIHSLLDQFPEVRKLLSGAGVALKPEDLIKQAPEVVNIIIANCAGDASEAGIEAAADLTLGEQFEMLKIIWDITFPNGVEALVEALKTMGLVIEPTWVAGMPSQEASSNSLPADIPQT